MNIIPILFQKMEDLSIYNPEDSDLRNVQLRMLEILDFVDSVCQRHNIQYWLGAGTLLGAVRHKGFIPWDDDLDIELTRSDYKKLIRILKKEMSSKYVLQTHRTDRNYVFPVAKLRDTASHITELNNADRNYKYRGVYIDIFFLDRGNSFLAYITNQLQKIVYAITLVKNDPVGILLSMKILIRSVIHNLIFPFLRFCARLFGIRSLILSFGTGFTAQRDMKDIFPVQKIMFEGKYFNAPADPDAYLRKIYGDYMKLPDEDQRRVHTVKYELF
jgi:lipopolysaccharide cholinephosphotransferase